ncbi:MAG: hypothetical protein WCQ95_05265 [Bacteroidota bacterium]
MTFFEKIKPGVPKRWLLAIAGVFWTFAGGMLLWRGLSGLIVAHASFIPDLLYSLAGGVLFYILLFSRISRKHVNRIIGLKSEKPCMFSFFNIKSYLLMSIMISGGVLLRIFNVVDHQILYSFYVCMAIPLLVSSVRFYYNWFIYQKTNSTL